MECRKGCAACCIHIHISSSFSGYPDGKMPEVSCVHLDENKLCKIWNTSSYPEVCRKFTPSKEFCGNSYEEAKEILQRIEKLTGPAGKI